MASGESGVSVVEVNMTTLKTMTIAALLLVGGASLAVAQNGPATGGENPVAGGAAGGGYPGYGYGYGNAAAPLPNFRLRSSRLCGTGHDRKAASLWMPSNALWWPRPTPEGSRHAGDI
jgi:hypothetical protein